MKIQCVRFDPYGGDVLDVLDTTDISRHGLGAISDRAFYPGQRVLLCIPLTPTKGRRSIHARVVRCRRGEDGYRVGMEFDSASMSLWQTTGAEVAAA